MSITCVNLSLRCHDFLTLNPPENSVLSIE